MNQGFMTLAEAEAALSDINVIAQLAEEAAEEAALRNEDELKMSAIDVEIAVNAFRDAGGTEDELHSLVV